MGFPTHRLRRLRRTEALRWMVQETCVRLENLVMPLFVRPGENLSRPIAPMPGQMQFSIDLLVEQCQELEALGIPGILLFGIPEEKDSTGASASDKNGIVQRAVRAIKDKCQRLLVITDVCLCEYTDHGHCGLLREVRGQMEVDNDRTLKRLAEIAVSHADAGADLVAPSDMMDGRVAAIRNALDKHDFEYVPIMSYAAKFASSFYGPFREAAESPPAFGDRKSYQQSCRNADEAMREIALDVEEGADIVMIKPALAYLDIVYRASQRFDLPIACYSVSGEYAMLKAAAQNGWLNEPGTVMEALIGMKRAGARIIITYFAKDVAEWIRAERIGVAPDGLPPGKAPETE
ncbi:MAG: porphobilinogen synthase [Phycisphaerae bacterium]|nr:porphobilinogen synthase [Phycisphaerae bacterium]